jgi:WD40 repeat protein
MCKWVLFSVAAFVFVGYCYSFHVEGSELQGKDFKGAKDKDDKDKSKPKAKNGAERGPTFQFRAEDLPKFGDCKNIGEIAISPDGRRVAVSGINPHVVYVWDLDSKKPLLGLEGVFERLAFTPDGKKLAAIGSTENRIILWDIDAGKELHKFDLPHWKLKGGITLAKFLAPANDGKAFLTVYDGTKPLRFGVADGKVDELPSSRDFAYYAVAYSPALDLLAAAQPRPNEVVLLKPGQKDIAKKVAVEHEPTALAFTKDGKTMAVSLKAKTFFDEKENEKLIDRVELWDTAQWKVRAAIPAKPSADFFSYEVMALSGDGKYLAGKRTRGEKYSVVELWDATSGKLMRTIDQGESPGAAC